MYGGGVPAGGPTRIDFKHQHDTPQDAAGHIKSTIAAPTMSLIRHGGALLLGHSQKVYFMEHDGPLSVSSTSKCRPVTRRLLDGYPYAGNVPSRGLFINGRPALTGIDPDAVGTTSSSQSATRCAPTTGIGEQIAGRLTGARLRRAYRHVQHVTGEYRGASVSVVSGGSGSPEANWSCTSSWRTPRPRRYPGGGSGGKHPDVRPETS